MKISLLVLALVSSLVFAGDMDDFKVDAGVEKNFMDKGADLKTKIDVGSVIIVKGDLKLDDGVVDYKDLNGSVRVRGGLSSRCQKVEMEQKGSCSSGALVVEKESTDKRNTYLVVGSYDKLDKDSKSSAGLELGFNGVDEKFHSWSLAVAVSGEKELNKIISIFGEGKIGFVAFSQNEVERITDDNVKSSDKTIFGTTTTSMYDSYFSDDEDDDGFEVGKVYLVPGLGNWELVYQDDETERWESRNNVDLNFDGGVKAKIEGGIKANLGEHVDLYAVAGYDVLTASYETVEKDGIYSYKDYKDHKFKDANGYVKIGVTGSLGF